MTVSRVHWLSSRKSSISALPSPVLLLVSPGDHVREESGVSRDLVELCLEGRKVKFADLGVRDEDIGR